MRRSQTAVVMEWTNVERAYAVEAYFSSGKSIIATQRAFRRHFSIAPRGRVPDQFELVGFLVLMSTMTKTNN